MKIKKMYAFVFILFFTAIAIFAGMHNKALKDSFIIERKITNDNIFPVLYFEEGIGGPGYGTYTYLLNGNEAFSLEKHNRTFSRTRPVSAYSRFKSNKEVYGEYGQMMVYYNTPEGEIFLFDSYKIREFTLIKNDIKVSLPIENFESYFDFLYFDGNYYLFTLAEPDILRTYKFSKDFVLEKSFDIDYGSLGITGHAFINNSLCVVDNTLVVMIKNRLLRYDFTTGEIDIAPVGYGLFGVCSDEDYYYAIGHTYTGEFVFEKFSPEGESLGKKEKALPFGFGYDSTAFSTDDTYYMYGSEIFLDFDYDGKCYMLSYDLESDEWTNYWIAEKEIEPFLPGNIKYMMKSGENYYDIFPHWNNS